jgi:hypothetical protein
MIYSAIGFLIFALLCWQDGAQWASGLCVGVVVGACAMRLGDP